MFRIQLRDIAVLLWFGYVMINYYFLSFPFHIEIYGLILAVCLYFIVRNISILSKYIYWGVLIWGCTEVIYGWLQLYGLAAGNHAFFKLTGSFLNPGPYSGFLATVLPLSLYIALHPSEYSVPQLRKIIPVFSWGIFFLLLGILPATMSRAGYLAAFTGCFIVLAGYYRLIPRFKPMLQQHSKQVVISILLFLCLGISLGIMAYFLKKDSADGRILMWKITTRVIAQNPWTGTGPGLWAGKYGQAQADYFAEGKATPQDEYVAGTPEHCFNEFLQITAETGLTGLFLFLFLLVSVFRETYRNRQTGQMAGLVAILTFACFSYPSDIVQLNILFILLLGTGKPDPNPVHTTLYNRQVWIANGTIILLLMLPVAYGIKLRQSKQAAIKEWHSEQIYYNIKIYEGTVDNYRKLYLRLRDKARFLFEYGQCLSQNGHPEESNRILQEGIRLSADPMFWNIMGKNYQALQLPDQAEACFIHASNIVPHRLYPLYLLANLYFSCGQTEKGVKVARQLIQKEPKIMSLAIDEMKTEMKKKIKNTLPSPIPQ